MSSPKKSKSKSKKENLVKAAAPRQISAADPLVVSFAFWQASELPQDVTIEVLELDPSTETDDDYPTLPDVLVRYTGTLVAAADDTAELADVKIIEVTSPVRSPDRVWIRLANQNDADIVEAGIPFSPAIKGSKPKEAEYLATEGSFYELAVLVRKGQGPDGDVLATSAATVVRQRADLLLAVEPLSQNTSRMVHDVGVRILETYHPSEIARHQPRNWGQTVLRIRDHIPMLLSSAGCSYVIVTMLLRYLRIDTPPPPASEEGPDVLDPRDSVTGQTVRLFDHHIRLSDLETKPDHKPRFFKDSGAAKAAEDQLADEMAAFVEHFVQAAEGLSKPQIAKYTKKLESLFKSRTKGMAEITMLKPHVEEDVEDTENYEPMSRPISDVDYLPMLVWKLHILDDRAHSYKLRRYHVNSPKLKLEGASDYRTLLDGEHEKWLPEFAEAPLMRKGKRQALFDLMIEGERGKSAGNDDGILVPISLAVTKMFGLIATQPHLDVADYASDEPGDPSLLPWQRFLVRTLDRGLPIIGLFSPGQYSFRNSGGHFCLIVGYRFQPDPADPAKKKIRFIINDPANANTHQYETHDEEELNPEGVAPTEVLKKNAASLGMKRERCGLNLIIERRMRLSLREVRVYEPAQGSSTSWVPARHSRFLYFRGKVQDVE